MAFHGSEHLFLSYESSDVTFIVENKSIPAHKTVLKSCPYFKTMMFGAADESKMSPTELKKVSYKMFVEVLRCIYQGKVGISDWTPDEVKQLILKAEEYQYPEMVCVIAESIDVDTQIVAILEELVSVAKKPYCEPQMERFGAALRRFTKLLLENQDVFDKLSMELICFLIDTGALHSADKRLVYSIGNWQKTASIEEKKRLLSKIDWKAVPGKYSAPLLRLFLDNHENGLLVEDWTNGLKCSNALVDLIAGVYTSFSGSFWISDFDSLFTELPAINNETLNGSVVIFFREQVTDVTKIKFSYDKQADITLRIFGEHGADEVTGTKINENWEFILPSNLHFSAAAIEINNQESNSEQECYYIRDLLFLSD